MCELTYDFLRSHEPTEQYEPGINAARREGIKGLYAPRRLPILAASAWAILGLVPLVTFGKLTMMRPFAPTVDYWAWLAMFALLFSGCLALVALVYFDAVREAKSSNRIIDFIRALDIDVPGLNVEPHENSCRVMAGLVPYGPYGSLPDGVDGCEIALDRKGEIVARFDGTTCAIKALEIGDIIQARYTYKKPRPEQPYLAGPWSVGVRVSSTAPINFNALSIHPTKVRYSGDLHLY